VRQEHKENIKMWRSGCLVSALLFGPPAQAAETLSIPSNPIPTAPGARAAPGPLSGRLAIPDTPGRHPVVILLHGCGGIGNGENMRRWSSRLDEWGYASLTLDSFAARHVRNVCAPEDQPKVTGIDRAGDVLNAAMALRDAAGIDPTRIGVVGFSHGGATAVTLTRKAFEAYSPGLIKVSVNYYGPCRQPEFHGTTPLLALSGDADNWGNPAATCKDFKAALRPNQAMESHVYEDVVHSFDNPDITPRRVVLGHPAQYDWTASRDSFERTHRFLDRYLR
jgi:dienelactone hydrolase